MLVIVSLALLGYEFFWLVVGVILVQGLFVVLIFSLIFRDIGWPQIKFAGLKNYLTYSVPMLPGDVLFWIVMASDRYFITHFLSISQTGIYSASAVLANLIGLLSWPIGIVLFPAVTRLWEQKDIVKVGSYFQYSLKLFLTLAVPAAGGLYVLSEPLLNVFTTSEFLVEGNLILLLAIGELFIGISVINEYQIFLVKKTKWLPLIYTIGAGTNAGINIVLIPKIGIFGAAISTIVSYSLLSVIITFWGRKMIDYKLDFGYALKVVLATIVMIGCLWFIDFKGIIGVFALIIIGIVIYGLIIFLLRAFSRQDMAVIKEALSGFKNKIKSS
jgi:O-antigen/teichoic acid export membrane protein